MRPESAGAVAAYVALGANLGDARAALLGAMEAMAGLPLTQVTRRSSLYRTAPLAGASDPPAAEADLGGDYINAVVELKTSLTAPALLLHLQALEHAGGRQRSYPNAPRTLDLDLLLYGSARIESQELTVPHPRMAQRAFVLVPLAEVAPGLVPQEQLNAVADQAIRRLDSNPP